MARELRRAGGRSPRVWAWPVPGSPTRAEGEKRAFDNPAVFGEADEFAQRQVGGDRVLTTNFDPLIEVAIRAAGGSCYSTRLDDDQPLNQTMGDGVHVVHLHGYWHGSDTLHRQSQLGRDRLQLRDSLRRRSSPAASSTRATASSRPKSPSSTRPSCATSSATLSRSAARHLRRRHLRDRRRRGRKVSQPARANDENDVYPLDAA
jgi:hypothetical protein